MNEIPSVLASKEKVLYYGKPSFAPYFFSYFLLMIIIAGVLGLLSNYLLQSLTSISIVIGILVGLFIFVIGILIIVLAYSRTQYAITDKRAIIQSGIIGRDFRSIDYDKMQNVSVNVGLLGVIFGVGTIQIFTGEMETVSTGKSSRIQPKYDKFKFVPNAYDTLKILQEQVEKRKESL